ncbi:DUF5713 family protein [Streptomyces sp. NPDC048442]|uniref:DUF5713 family protein n=1 Tax=Streptomyces sp. NPDC048442 TaxID=3154823 RepID=UPI003418847B
MSSVTNQQVKDRVFLRALYGSDYYPEHVLDRGRAVLAGLCERIEAERPADLAALYVLTEVATEQFNDLEAEFDEAGSEIDTIAREEIAGEFRFVAKAYGFANADTEELVAAREW